VDLAQLKLHLLGNRTIGRPLKRGAPWGLCKTPAKKQAGARLGRANYHKSEKVELWFQKRGEGTGGGGSRGFRAREAIMTGVKTRVRGVRGDCVICRDLKKAKRKRDAPGERKKFNMETIYDRSTGRGKNYRLFFTHLDTTIKRHRGGEAGRELLIISIWRLYLYRRNREGFLKTNRRSRR